MMNRTKLIGALLAAGLLAAVLGQVASAISPDYLPDGRTYDQQRTYIDWNGPVSLVTIYHKDLTTIPPEEGGDSCNDGCVEQVTRIYNGGSVSGNFINLQGFNVQVANTGDGGAGRAIIRACGQVIATEQLYKPGAKSPGFYNAPSPMWPVPTAGDCTWSITASGGYVDFRAVTVDARAGTLPTVNLQINNQVGPLSLTEPAGYTLTWTTTNVDTCTASGDWMGEVSISGNRPFASIPTGTYSYTLTCASAYGTDSETVVAQVFSRPTVEVKVDSVDGPLTYTRPANFVVSWTSAGASSCQADGDLVRPISISGSSIFANVDVGEYSYIVRCSNPAGDGVVDSVSVSVRTPLPEVDLQVNGVDGPLTLISPADLNLTWRSANADACTGQSLPVGLFDGGQALNGSNDLSALPAGEYDIRLRCWNVAGSSMDSVIVTVVDPLSGNLTINEARLVLYPSNLDQPAQVITGEVTGGVDPYISTISIRLPSGSIQTYRQNGSDWTLDADNTGDRDLGATQKGTWTAWAELRDGLGQTFRTANATWEVAWFPVHGLP